MESNDELTMPNDDDVPYDCVMDDEQSQNVPAMNAGLADWLLGKLAAIRAEQDRIRAYSSQRIDELDADYNRLWRRYEMPLDAWAHEESDKRKRKTVTLFNGAIVLRTVPGRFSIADKAAAMALAKKELPDAITNETLIIEKLDSKAFLAFANQRMQETGEILDCMERSESRETLSLDLSPKK